jgi:hypothetical protein
MLRQQRELLERNAADAQSAQPQGSMWADHNPGKPIQPCRERTRRPQTTTEKKTAWVRSKTMAKNADALGSEIKAFYSFQDKFIQQLAQKYERKEPDIRQLILSKPVVKAKRAVSLTNALLHRKTKELNEGNVV